MPAPTADRVPARRRGLAAARHVPFVALVAALVACAAPTSGPRLELDPSSVEVLRGGSVTVSVTLLAGHANEVALGIAGLPTGVTASFAPLSLGGTTTTSALTLAANANAPAGPRAVVVSGTSDVGTARVDLTLDVAGLDVAGRVVTILGLGVPDVTVAIDGSTAVTDPDGAFAIADVAVPYDVVLSVAGGSGDGSSPAVHVFEGLTSPNPALSPSFGYRHAPALTRSAFVEGDALGGAAVADDHAVVVCVEGLDALALGCARVAAGATTYRLPAAWRGSATLSARVHALHFSLQATGLPGTYLGYGRSDLELTAEATHALDLAFAALDGRRVEGLVALGEGLALQQSQGYVRFGPGLALPLFEGNALAEAFDLSAPDLPGTTLDLRFRGEGANGRGVAWVRGVGGSAGTTAVPAPNARVGPSDGATGVGATTAFVAVGGGAVRTFFWTPELDGPEVSLTTVRSSVVLPDLGVVGGSYPPGAAYRWFVFGHGPSTVDAAAARGLADYYEHVTLHPVGGPGIGSDGTFSITLPEWAFELAP